jgi:AcrR family transcriptional regulator
MAPKNQSRKSPSDGAMKLILAAEKLFGEHGIEGVSLRQIINAAGLVNSYSIHHHFGSKEGLVQAVFDNRVPAFEEACRARLDAEKAEQGELTLRGLLAARFMPLVECFDEQTRQSYSRFLLRLLYRSEAVHPYLRSEVPQPAINEVYNRLRNHFADLPNAVFISRFRFASDMFFGAIVEQRRLKRQAPELYQSDADYWNEILEIIEHVFHVPYRGQPAAPLTGVDRGTEPLR